VDDETLKKVAALFGEDAVRVVEVLKGVNEITDIEIADKTQIRLNLVRKALYRLYDRCLINLVLSERDKNIAKEFKGCIRENPGRTFLRAAWEDIYHLVMDTGLGNMERAKMIEYFKNKTFGYRNGRLLKAFST
jgi:hypothetical protein